MAKKKLLGNKVLFELKVAEKFLFDTYNWKASNDLKIKHLQALIDVIKAINKEEKVDGNRN